YLVLGYSHTLDSQYAAAIPYFKKAQLHAGELSDYADYFLASSEGAAGDATDAAENLRGFDQRYPGSILSRDAVVILANALLAQKDPQSALRLLEEHRDPPRADVELVLGRAESAKGNNAGAITQFRHVYYGFPLAPESGTAEQELGKLGNPGGIAPPSFA